MTVYSYSVITLQHTSVSPVTSFWLSCCTWGHLWPLQELYASNCTTFTHTKWELEFCGFSCGLEGFPQYFLHVHTFLKNFQCTCNWSNKNFTMQSSPSLQIGNWDLPVMRRKLLKFCVSWPYQQFSITVKRPNCRPFMPFLPKNGAEPEISRWS